MVGLSAIVSTSRWGSDSGKFAGRYPLSVFLLVRRQQRVPSRGRGEDVPLGGRAVAGMTCSWCAPPGPGDETLQDFSSPASHSDRILLSHRSMRGGHGGDRGKTCLTLEALSNIAPLVKSSLS